MSVDTRKDTPGTYEFTMVRQPKIDIAVAYCEVEFATGLTRRVVVEGSLDAFTVSRGSDNSVVIIQKNMAGGGAVIINGVRIKPDGLQAEDAPPLPKVRVIAPQGSILEGNFQAGAKVTGTLNFSRASASVNSSAHVALSVHGALNAKVSGGSFLGADLFGELKVIANGSGVVSAVGRFTTVEAFAMSGGCVETNGDCTGDYDASANSLGSIRHTGRVDGRIRNTSPVMDA